MFTYPFNPEIPLAQIFALMATIEDIAKHVGVSTATISHVINNTRFVSEGLEQKILKAIQELNYQPNAVARSLVNPPITTVGHSPYLMGKTAKEIPRQSRTGKFAYFIF